MWQKMVIVMITPISKGDENYDSRSVNWGIKALRSRIGCTIFDNNNDEQYDVSFIIEDEEKNSQVMIVFEGK